MFKLFLESNFISFLIENNKLKHCLQNKNILYYNSIKKGNNKIIKRYVHTSTKKRIQIVQEKK